MMAGSVAERRGALRQALVESAEGIVADGGLSALRAREVAASVGCAVGAIYTHFPDMNALGAAVNARTLHRLEEQVAHEFSSLAAPDPKKALVTLGVTYHAFVEANPKLWSAIFELGYRQGDDTPAPEAPEHHRLLDLIVAPLRTLLPHEHEKRLRTHARTLFSAIHGVVVLSQQRRFIAVPREEVPAEIAFVVEAFCDGIRKQG